MRELTRNALGDWSPFAGHSCSPGSCDCTVTAPDETLEQLEPTAPWLDPAVDDGLYPYVARAFQK